uniref:Uncharacterized protein n=1 Tax=Phlebotomus papatasi TaxID=29031 RepID=A0A1B0D419_PHLPP
MSDEEAPVVSGEKKRGRPAGDKEKAVEAKKRPRTSSSEASEGKKVVENGNLPAKRGRGRPKAPVKAVATKGRAEKKTSRGRGRPKAAGKKLRVAHLSRMRKKMTMMRKMKMMLKILMSRFSFLIALSPPK